MTAFLNAIGSVVSGSYTSARLSMSVPSDLDLLNAVATWELLDQQGRIWTHGEPTDLVSEASQVALNQKTVSAEAEIAVPSSLPANPSGTTYQLRWTIKLRSGTPLYAFENFVVLPATNQAQGAVDVIELLGDIARVQLTLPKQYQFVEYECFRGNSRLFSARSASAPVQSADGYTYAGQVMPDEYLQASLDPFTIIWSYWDGVQTRQRETTQMFIATPIILDAVKDMQTWLNRAYIDSGTQPGTTFEPVDYIKYLRLGRDQFNAADKPTSFTLTAADGPIRWFWIGYSCVAACRSQYLAEGMKAFNYSGQVVQLDVDRTPFWDQMAQAMESQLAEQVKPFKDNLIKRGVVDGDGSNMALRRGAVGAIGVTIHGMSPLRGAYGLSTPLTPIIR
jgi:hypothetical protein